MPKFDVERAASPDNVARAIADYGDELDDLRYEFVAMLISQGEPISKAYARAFPDAAPATARTQASILCAHPDMRRMISDQMITARNLITAALPRSVRKTVELMNAESEQVQLKAASSIQDRAGLPAAAELSVHSTIIGASLYQSAAEDSSEILTLTPIEEEPTKALEAATGEATATATGPSPTLSDLETSKATWASLAPKP